MQKRDPFEDEKIPRKQIRGDAVKRLRTATARKVRDNSELIAESLLYGALKGDVSRVKLMFALIENKKPRKTTKKTAGKTSPYDSIALKWASEPEWQGPIPTGDGDFDKRPPIAIPAPQPLPSANTLEGK
jgi:hypothetical protein